MLYLIIAILVAILIFTFYLWHNGPHLRIYRRDNVEYLRRWHLLPRNKWFKIYLHHFVASDEDEALHDHQYDNVSLVLKGSYLEHSAGDHVRWVKPFRPVFRKAEQAHRVELLAHDWHVWSLFFCGPWRREWGFWCKSGWRHWRDYVGSADYGKVVGPGCGD